MAPCTLHRPLTVRRQIQSYDTPNKYAYILPWNEDWEKPRDNWIKVNSDACLQISDFWGLGAVIRDREEAVLASATWKVEGYNDPVMAEAFGMYKAIELAKDCCPFSVIFRWNHDIYQMSYPETI